MKPMQELSAYALSMQAPLRSARPSHFSCLPLHASARRSSPATYSSASSDEAEYGAVADENAGEDVITQQQLARRAHSCSKLPGMLVPSFKSLLNRAHSLSHLPHRHSQSCSTLAAQSKYRSATQPAQGKRAPKGHVAVYVEAGRERHVVPIAYLSHPHFQALLERSESEFGLRPTGPGLRIPCSLSELHHTLHQIRTQ